MKKFSYLIFMLFCYVWSLSNAYAATVSVKVTSTSMTLGNSVTVTTSFNSSNTIFFIEGTLSCSGAGVSKTQNLTFDNTANNVYSKSFSLSIKPTTTGKVTCTAKDLKIIDSSKNSWQTISNKTTTITVNKAYVAPPKVYSSNNYLSSLTVEGYELDSKFNKETLDYSVTVKEGTEKIKVNAQLADSTAKVSGIGSLNVSEGVNNFSFIVTAENGSKRTYNLKVIVKEFEPINVSVNNLNYILVRKRKDLPKVSEYFVNKDVTILENNIEGYYYEDLDYTLLGLKDKDGNVKLYVYKDGKYTLYNEQVFNGMTLRILDKELPNGYAKKKFKYNDTDITGYQEVKMDIIKNTYALDDNEIVGNSFYLFYAINLDTKKEELYQYDAVEKTVQRYNTLILDMHKERSNQYYLYLVCSVLALGFTIILFSIILVLKSRKKDELKAFEHGDLL